MDSLPHIFRVDKPELHIYPDLKALRDAVEPAWVDQAALVINLLPDHLVDAALELADLIEARHGGQYDPLLSLFLQVVEEPSIVAKEGPLFILPPDLELRVMDFAAQVAEGQGKVVA